jgi:hypothetical protein
MSETLPAKPSIDKIGAAGKIGDEGGGAAASPTQAFDSYMKQPMGTTGQPSPTTSPFALAGGQAPLATTPTFNTLLAQTTAAQGALGGIQTQLTTPNLKLKASQKYLLRNKLSDATSHLRTANAKLGADPGPEPELPSAGGPIVKFLSYITDGQNQIAIAKEQLEKVKAKGENLSPADMLLVQIKLNKAQQEIEYSSVLLSKAVDAAKQLMNVQI